jgi:hypothetical protein
VLSELPTAQEPLLLLGPAPCDECRFRERCGSLLLACEAYRVFVRDLNAPWDFAPRSPTRDRYLAIFSDEADGSTGSQLRWLDGRRD